MSRGGFCKIFSILVTALTCVVIVFASVVSVPALFGVSPYIVETDVMEPAIPVGSIAFVNNRDVTPEKEQCFLFVGENGEKDIRKAVAIDGEEISVRKDNAIYTESRKVNVNDVVGVVAFTVPWLGYIMSYMSLVNCLLAIGLLIALNVLASMCERRKE